MNERGNEIFVRDRMNRDGADYEGSGVGEGRYDAGEERANKFKEILLPLVLVLFMVCYWGITIYFTVMELKYTFYAEKYEVAAEDYQEYVVIKRPDNTYRNIPIDNSNIIDGKVTVYYEEDDDTAYIRQSVDTWIMSYGFGLLITFLLLFWIKKILFQKKHAVEKKPEHSYKDY